MTRFEPDMQAAAADLADTSEPPYADEERPARRLLAHDADDSWLLDDGDGWRPID